MKIETPLIVAIVALTIQFILLHLTLSDLRATKKDLEESQKLNIRVLKEAKRTMKNNDALIGICGDVQDLLARR